MKVNSNPPSFESYQVKENKTPEAVRKSIEDNGKVDIVLENKAGDMRVISGDKIDLKELGGLSKPLAEFVEQYDENRDGKIEEKELKKSTKESIGQWSVATGLGGMVLSAAFGGPIGFAVMGGLGAIHEARNHGEYQTKEWDNQSPIKTIR